MLAAARRGDPAMMAPSVWLLSPGSGQSVSGSVTVAATASQDTQTLQFLLNGANLGPAITSGACSMNWNTAAAGDGNYTVSVVAFDSTGNSTTSAPASVLVENSAAQISSVATSTITTNSATVTWTTNQMSSSGVDYGLGGYMNSTPLDVTLTTLHVEALVGLSAGTTYHFRVSSWNGVGLLATSTDFTFTTASNTSVGIPSSPAGSPPSGSFGTTGSTTASAPPVVTCPEVARRLIPFTAMGGGTCSNGGWYPPGFGTSIATVPAAPATAAPTTNVSAAAGGCRAPDPFVAIGGGTCINGGWLPGTVAAAVRRSASSTRHDRRRVHDHRAGGRLRRVRDVRSLRCDGRRHVLQPWVVPARHAPGSGHGDGGPVDLDARELDAGNVANVDGLHDSRPVQQHSQACAGSAQMAAGIPYRAAEVDSSEIVTSLNY